MSTIILTGGGTAGHCNPNLALVPYLKNKFDKIYYIGSKNGIERNIVSKTDIPYYYVSCAKLRRNLSIDNLSIPFKVIKGIRQAEKLINELKPDVIFSKGGYVSVPVVIAGKRKNIPIISHESDYSIGLANKITAKCCKKVLTSFPETATKIKNGEYVGSPLKKSLFSKIDKEKIYAKFNLEGNKPILLITGGSQGASVINNCVRLSLSTLLKKYDIIHICGKGNLDVSHKEKGYVQIEFTNKIEEILNITSICVSRAGSNTVFELLSLKIPTLLIPLATKASRGDQILNAKYFYQLGMVNLLYQEDMNATSLINAITTTYNCKNNLIKNIEKNPIENASEKISKIIIEHLN